MTRQRTFRPGLDYTPAMLSFLEEGYKHMDAKTLTEAFNRRFRQDRTVDAIKGTCFRKKFKAGRSGHFVKGQLPWNTGTRGVMQANSGTFSKGNVPASLKPMWHERAGKDGYIEMKVPERNPYTGFETRYKQKHLWLWEQANGPIPDGHCVRFKDGNKRNFDMENLVLVSRGVNGVLNKRGYGRLPQQFRDTAIVIAKIEEQIRKRTES